MDPLSAVASAFSELFGWFGAISQNNSIEKTIDVEQEETYQAWTYGLSAQSSANALRTNQMIMYVSFVFIVLMVSVVLISNRKK